MLYYNYPVKNNDILKTLTYLEINENYNQEFMISELPDTLTHLIFNKYSIYNC